MRIKNEKEYGQDYTQIYIWINRNEEVSMRLVVELVPASRARISNASGFRHLKWALLPTYGAMRRKSFPKMVAKSEIQARKEDRFPNITLPTEQHWSITPLGVRGINFSTHKVLLAECKSSTIPGAIKIFISVTISLGEH